MWYQVVSRSNTLIFLLPCPAISPAARPYSQPPALHPLPAKITEAWLARRLSSFGIRSHTIRIGPDRARGYHLAEFVPAFDRFLVAKCDTVTNPLPADSQLLPAPYAMLRYLTVNYGNFVAHQKCHHPPALNSWPQSQLSKSQV